MSSPNPGDLTLALKVVEQMGPGFRMGQKAPFTASVTV